MKVDQTSETGSKLQLNGFLYKSCHGHNISSQQQKIKTKIGTREWDIALTDLTMLLVGGMWNFVCGLRKKLNVLIQVNGPYQQENADSSANSNVDYGVLVQEVSQKSISKWPRYYFCGILARNVNSFFLCSKYLPEAQLKSFILMLGEEILRQSTIDIKY